MASKVIAAEAACSSPDRLRSEASALATLADCCSAPAASMNAAPIPAGPRPPNCRSIACIADSTRTAEARLAPVRPIPATALVTSMRLMLRKTLLGS